MIVDRDELLDAICVHFVVQQHTADVDQLRTLTWSFLFNLDMGGVGSEKRGR